MCVQLARGEEGFQGDIEGVINLLGQTGIDSSEAMRNGRKGKVKAMTVPNPEIAVLLSRAGKSLFCLVAFPLTHANRDSNIPCRRQVLPSR